MEIEIYKGHPSWLNYIISITFCSVLTTAIIVLASGNFNINVSTMDQDTRNLFHFVTGLDVFIFLAVLYSKYSFTFILTEQRVISRRGIISRNTSEIELIDIRNIQLQQGILSRLFGIGYLYIGSAGTGGIEVVFRGINNPQKVKEMIRDHKKKQLEKNTN